MTDIPAEQALLPFAMAEREAPTPPAALAPATRLRTPKPSRGTTLTVADPTRIAFHPAFGGAEDLLALRYEKDADRIVAGQGSGGAPLPLAVSQGDASGDYVLIGHPAGLVAARRLHTENAAYRVAVLVEPQAGPAAHYASMTTSLRRPSDWERYMVASYHVEQTGSARAAMSLLGLDPAKNESGFSRLLSVGKLLAAIPGLDPLTVSATNAAKVIALRADRRIRDEMDTLAKQAAAGADGLLDARKLLPRLIATADPGSAPPGMVKVETTPDAWTFQCSNHSPIARVVLLDQIWSVQLLQAMDATTWRTFSKAVAVLMGSPATCLQARVAQVALTVEEDQVRPGGLEESDGLRQAATTA